MEILFPGIHLRRPDIAEHEAGMFLAGAHRFPGVDLDDPTERLAFLDCPRADFRRFKVNPRPSLKAMLDSLPEGWEEREELHSSALAITDLTDTLYDLPGRGLCAVIMPHRELWITKR